MKAQVFLELVGRMLTAQQDYFAARKRGLGVITTQDLLVKSKGLEKQVLMVVKEGRLEADAPALSTLDLSGNERPTDEQGDTKQ